MTIVKKIPEGGLIPWGYGVAWRNCYDMYVICYPLPFNFAVRGWNHWYYKVLKHCFPSRYEGELLAARLEGMNAMRNHLRRELDLLVQSELKRIGEKRL